MKPLLILGLALTASLASAQTYGQSYRDHEFSHEHHHLSVPSLGCRSSRPTGYWTTHYETVFVPGSFVASLNHCGQTQLIFVPAHYETVSRQVWVARGW